MKTKQNAKAIKNLEAQAVEVKQIKGGGEKNVQVLKGRQSSNPITKPSRIPVDQNTAELKLVRNLKK